MWQRLAVLLFLLLSVSLAQAATTPTADFTDNGDGTVTHMTTGLTWKRCSEGQTWTGSTCSGTAGTYTWNAAMALGSNGWGLPTIEQLRTIVVMDNYYPTINRIIFPNTPGEYFWSASGYVGNSEIYYMPAISDGAWTVNFFLGNEHGRDKTDSYYVRLVRTGQPVVTSPTVTSVSPTSATLDQLTTFTVQGQNLTSGMGFTVGDCEYSNTEVGSGSATQRTFECTPRGTTGAKTSLVKTAPGGTTLYSFSVDVTNATPLVTNIDVNPKTAVLNQPTVFTVTGTNLTSGMGFTVGDCEYSNAEIGTGTSSERYYFCTPKGSSGDKLGIVKTAPGGNVLKNFSVRIDDTPTYSNIDAFVFPSGDISNMTLDAYVSILPEDEGQTGNVYVATVVGGQKWFFDGIAWRPDSGNVYPAAFSGTLNNVDVFSGNGFASGNGFSASGSLASKKINIAKNANLTPYAGMPLFVGYSAGANLSTLKFRRTLDIGTASNAPKIFTSDKRIVIQKKSTTIDDLVNSAKQANIALDFNQYDSFSPSVSHSSALMAKAAYLDDAALKTFLSQVGFEQPTNYNNNGVFGNGYRFFTAKRTKSDGSIQYVISIRGTVPPQVGSSIVETRKNLETDFDIRPTTFENVKGVLHTGFADLAKTVWGNLDTSFVNEIAQSPKLTTTVTITGHSLGGAAANILHARFVEQCRINNNEYCKVKVQTYTFGAPVSGYKDFVDNYSGQKIFRVQKEGDIIPSVGALLGTHIGQRIGFAHEFDWHYPVQTGVACSALGTTVNNCVSGQPVKYFSADYIYIDPQSSFPSPEKAGSSFAEHDMTMYADIQRVFLATKRGKSIQSGAVKSFPQ